MSQIQCVRWRLLQQHTTAAPPAAAAPANSTKVPAAAIPVSTVAHSNSLPMSLSPPETTLDHISRAAFLMDDHCPLAFVLVASVLPPLPLHVGRTVRTSGTMWSRRQSHAEPRSTHLLRPRAHR